jgi:WD40 repeat protein
MVEKKKPAARKSRKSAPPLRPMGVSLPLPTARITASNVAQVVTLARWGWSEPEEMAWSPDGARLALASYTGTFIVDAASLVEVAQGSGREADWARAVAWSQDGQYLATATGGSGCPVHIWSWDGKSLVRLRTLKLDDVSYKGLLTFSPDGTILAFKSMRGVVFLFRVVDGTRMGVIEPPQHEVDCLTFSPDSKLLAVFGHRSGTAPSPIRLWPVSGGEPVGEFPVGELWFNGLGFTPDGAILLANRRYTSDVSGWEVTGGRQLTDKELSALRLPPSRCLTSNLATDADGRLMAAISSQGVKIVRPNSTKVAIRLPGDTQSLRTDFSPDVTRLLSSKEGLLAVVNLADGSVAASRQGSIGWVTSIAIAPDGAAVAVAASSSDSWVRFWRLTDGTVTGELSEVGEKVAYTPDGTRLLAGSRETGVNIREVPSGKEVARLPDVEMTCVAVSPDGQRFAIGTHQGEVSIGNVSTGTLLFTLAAHKKPVGAVAFLPDGQTLFSAGTDLWGRLWRVEDGEPVAKLKHTRSVLSGAVSPDGAMVATACADKMIYLWDASDGKEVRAIPAGRSGAQVLAWSARGDILVSTSGKLIELWNPATGASLGSLRGHNRDVAGLAFTPDGALLISGSRDNTLRLWGLS